MGSVHLCCQYSLQITCAQLQHQTQIATQTGDARRGGYDPDELEEEARDREKLKRINGEFKRFTAKVQEVWDTQCPRLKLEWDKPVRCGAYAVVAWAVAEMCSFASKRKAEHMRVLAVTTEPLCSPCVHGHHTVTSRHVHAV